jgi:hypothetical protein
LERAEDHITNGVRPTDGNFLSKRAAAAKKMLMHGYSFQQNC